MGLLNTLGLGLMGSLFGGDEKKPIEMPTTVKDPDYKSPSQIAAEEDAKKKAALLAANAGGSQPTTVGGGNADVTQKTLLGL